MATERRLIEYSPAVGQIQKLHMDAFRRRDKAQSEAYKKAWDILMDAPTVDAVEVVHCCDCQKCTVLKQAGYREPLLFCKHWKGNPMVDPTDFCSFGERRTET